MALWLFIYLANMFGDLQINSIGEVAFTSGVGGIDIICGICTITINSGGSLKGGTSGNLIRFYGNSWTNSGIWIPETGK